MRRPLIALTLLAVLAVLAACGERARDAPGPDLEGFYAVPASRDRGDACADVGDAVRACFGQGAEGDGCERGVCVTDRPLPPVTAPTLGFVCVGRGDERRCRDRRARSLLFSCGDSGCVQEHPTLPDDGEWECMDAGGAAVCRQISAAAGVSSGAEVDQSSFRCGSREGRSHELICVDLSPDTPEGSAVEWDCNYDQHRGIRRTCMRTTAPRLGSPCDGDPACPEGARCIARRCMPPALSPGCWLDEDCEPGRACRFGSCVGNSP